MPPRSRTKPGSTSRRPKVAGLRQHAHAGAGAATADPVEAPDAVEDRADAPTQDPVEAPTETRTDASATTASPAQAPPEGATASPATEPAETAASGTAEAPAADAETGTAEPAAESATGDATVVGDTTSGSDAAIAPADTAAVSTPVQEKPGENGAQVPSTSDGATDAGGATTTTADAGTVTTPRTGRARRGARMTPRPVPAEERRDGAATTSPTRTAKPTRSGGRTPADGAPGRFARLRAALRRFAGSRALPVTLVAVTVVCLALGGLAFWKGRQAWTSGPVSNQAVIDVGGTAELVGQSREAIEKIFSYDFSRLDDSAEAARTMSTGEFTNRYMSVFDQTIRQPAQQQQLRQTATVVNIGVTQLRDDRATVMALTQFSAQRTTTGQSTNAPGLLRLDMQRVDGRWKLAELTPLTANP